MIIVLVAKMLEEDIEIAMKVVVVGNGAVGKSSMIQRYCKNVFTKEYKKTIGVDFLEKLIRLTRKITLELYLLQFYILIYYTVMLKISISNFSSFS